MVRVRCRISFTRRDRGVSMQNHHAIRFALDRVRQRHDVHAASRLLIILVIALVGYVATTPPSAGALTSTWSSQSLPWSTSGESFDSLRALSCVSSTSCVAV